MPPYYADYIIIVLENNKKEKIKKEQPDLKSSMEKIGVWGLLFGILLLSISATAVEINSSTIFPVTITDDSILTSNVIVNGTAVMVVAADDITLNCNGFSITGNTTGIGFNASFSSPTNITITNCVISNFSQNIFFSGAINSTIINNTLNNSVLDAMSISGTNVSIINNTAQTSGSAALTTGGNNLTISGNRLFGAVNVFNSTGGFSFSLLEHNLFNGTNQVVSIGGGSNNLFNNNTFISSGTEALIISTFASNNFTNNIINATNLAISMQSLSHNNRFINTTGVSTASIVLVASGILNTTIIGGSYTGSTAGGNIGTNATLINTTFATTTGSAIVVVDNSTLTNVTLQSGANWIQIAGTLPSNSTNLTFSNATGGSIRIIGNATLPAGTTIGQTNVSIGQNRAFLNANQLPYFNQSAQITLHNVGSSVPYFDATDSGVFIPCSPARCVSQSFNGSTGVFNVTSFTTYSVSNSSNVTVNISKTDLPSAVIPGQTLIYQINYTVLNGTSFNTSIQENYPSQFIFINASPAANVSNNVWFAGNLTNGQQFQINITLQVNSSIVSSSIVNNTVNTSFANSSGTIFNLNVTENTTINASFPITVITNVTLLQNITVFGDAFVFNTSNITFNCNGNIITGSGAGSAFNLSSGLTTANISMINCQLRNFSSGIVLESALNVSVTNVTLNSTATWLSTDGSSNATLINVTFTNGNGSLTSLSQINVTFSSSAINTSNLNIRNGTAFVNTSQLPFMNTTFRVQLDNLNLTSLSVVVDFEDGNGPILCTDCTLVSFNGTTAIFDVSHFTTYTTVDGGVNFTLSKTASPTTPQPGGQVTYTITLTINSGFAHNITVIENPPIELTFDSSTPANVSANTWNLSNLSAGQSAQINVTYNISSNFTGTLNNTINVSFQNSTNQTIFANLTTQNIVQVPASGGQGGGGGGGGGSSLICPALCQNPAYKDLAQCRNCPSSTQTTPSTTQTTTPTFPTVQQQQSLETKSETTQGKEQAAPTGPTSETTLEEKITTRGATWSYAFAIILLVFIIGGISIYFLQKLGKNSPPKSDVEDLTYK